MAEETITVRVPADLKQTIIAAGEARGMTLTGFVCQALLDAVAPTRRLYEHPGLSPTFQAFFDRIVKEEGCRPDVLLLVVDQGGHRALYRGRIDGDISSDSLVAVGPPGSGETRILLRRDVVGWFDGLPAHLNRVAMHFVEQGWFPVELRS